MKKIIFILCVCLAGCGNNDIIVACGGGNVANKYYYVPRSIKAIGCYENTLRYQNDKEEWVEVLPFA